MDAAIAAGVVVVFTNVAVGYVPTDAAAPHVAADTSPAPVEPVSPPAPDATAPAETAVAGAEPAPEPTNPAPDNGLLAQINSSEMFASGSASLSPSGRDKFARIAHAYAQRVGADAIRPKLLITGHTDGQGSAQQNQRLSEARARDVAALFVQAGFDPSDLFLKGAGSAQPIAPNDTPAGREQNRRVEILEIDSEEHLLAYSAARRHDRNNLAHASSAATPGRATPEPTKAPPRPLAKPLSESSSNDREPGTDDPYGFHGTPAADINRDVFAAIGPAPHRARWNVVPQAQAADTLPACYRDQVRVEGEVLRYSDNSSLESHHTRDFLPGMFGGGWKGLVGETTVGFGPVAVLREGAQPVGAPTVYLAGPHPHLESFGASVATYDGESGVLYRVYLTDRNAPIACFDVALPKSGQPKSASGWLFYRARGGWKQAAYQPELVDPR
jgi:outer membrane protein OmpA-like peptidoglycan-associated protein